MEIAPRKTENQLLVFIRRWLSLLWESKPDMFMTSTAIDRRILLRMNALEILSIILISLVALIFAVINNPYDFSIYINAFKGNFDGYYYAYWLLPIFSLLVRLPLWFGYTLWSMANISGLFFAARVFGGRSYFILLGFQSFYILFYGQITGIIVGALALFFWSLTHDRPYLAGFAFSIAAVKFQLGIPAGLFLWLIANTSWRIRLQALIVPCLVTLTSLVIYPYWPLELINRIITSPPDAKGSISLWRWIGSTSLLLWIPPLVFPMKARSRLLSLLAVMALAFPYFQQADLLLLFSFPIGLVPLLCGNLGYLYFLMGWNGLAFITIAPLLVYIAIVGGEAAQLITTHSTTS